MESARVTAILLVRGFEWKFVSLSFLRQELRLLSIVVRRALHSDPRP